VADGITISGGGSFAVATDELFRLAQSLEIMRDESGAAKNELTSLSVSSPLEASSMVDHEVHRVLWSCERAVAELGRLESEAGFNAFALRSSAEAYGVTDRVIASAVEELTGALGYGIGLVAPFLFLDALRVLALGVGIAYVAIAATHGGPEGVPAALESWMQDNRALLNNSTTVELVRLAMMSTDNAVAGVVRMPYGVSELLEGVGIAGISSTALGAILAGNRAGLFAETPVSVKRISTTTVLQAPTGLADRIERLPDPKHNTDGEQIRIDRFEVTGEPDRFEVYIAGTVDFSPASANEPFDLTSNVFGMAELPAGSYRGIEEALKQAGVSSINPVVFTGHSQGGLLAALLANSGNYDTHGVITIGAPTGQISPSGDYPVIAIEHTDDVVPALGGRRSDVDTIVVRRAAIGGAPLPDDIFFPAHERTAYAETAQLADMASTQTLRDAITTIDGVTGGAAGKDSTTWLATRRP
jgi:hypothetical protein